MLVCDTNEVNIFERNRISMFEMATTYYSEKMIIRNPKTSRLFIVAFLLTFAPMTYGCKVNSRSDQSLLFHGWIVQLGNSFPDSFHCSGVNYGGTDYHISLIATYPLSHYQKIVTSTSDVKIINSKFHAIFWNCQQFSGWNRTDKTQLADRLHRQYHY